MRILNLGILAHVDAGKTTLTERLLYTAGVVKTIGSVDEGSTQTDFLPLERLRGITIKSAVVSFVIGETAVNLIDTPGHPDFIAEVERVLAVLDGVVLVVSAVEGVQPQTRVLMRTLQRLHIPTILFVNKIDRMGASDERVLRGVSERLTPAIVAMGSVEGPGTREARFMPYHRDDAEFTPALHLLLAERDDALLSAYVDGDAPVPCDVLWSALAEQTGRALVHPVFFGSAITGAGVDALMAGIEALLPAAAGDASGPVRGTVFKVEHGPVGEKVAYARLFSGTVRTRDRLRFGRDCEGKVTAIATFRRGPASPSPLVSAGEIAKLWGLAEVRIGDTIREAHADGDGTSPRSGGAQYFAPPTMETAVVPGRPSEKAALHIALAQLAETDPLINLRQDDRRGEMYVSLYGEVQKEVIEATLAGEYGIDVHFRETTPIYVERPVGSGEAVEWLGKGGNPFVATLGLRVEPAPEGGITLRLAVEVGTIPLYVYKSVDEFARVMEETVRSTLRCGLHGWQVTGCAVTLTACGYISPASSARDFRLLTPLVLMSALREAGTGVYEPIHRFRLEVPADAYGTTVPLLHRAGAVLRTSAARAESYVLEGQIPAGQVHLLQHGLPAATHGEGVLDYDFDGYAPISGTIPTRPRFDNNPLDRKEYLLHVLRRV